jgi:hypothetical protein
MKGILRRTVDRLYPQYQVYAILGASLGEPAWAWSVWSRIYPEVSRLATVLGAEASIDSRQVRGPQSAGVRFGRLPWSEAGHQRWAHGSPLNAAECVAWVFVDAQVHIPARSPQRPVGFSQVYLQVSPEVVVPDRRTAYDQRALLCAKLDTFQAYEQEVRSLLRVIEAQLHSIATLSEVRRVASPGDFESILREDLSYRGRHLDALPDLSKARGRWHLEARDGA